MVRSYVIDHTYILYSVLCNITALPSKLTLAPLSAAVAVSALVLHKDSSNIMDKLEQIGATDILLFAINNSRM